MAGFDNTRLDIEIAAKNLTGPAFQQVNAQLEKLNQSAAASAGATSRLEGAMGSLRAGMAALPMAAVAAGFTRLHDSTSQLAIRINDQSEALGLTIRQYQALQLAAARAGVEETKAAEAVGALNIKIGEAVQGKKAAVEAFDRLGVKILDVNGKQRSEVSILEEVALKLSKVEDTAKRAALAKDLLGSSGAKLTALLRTVGGGLESTATEAERVGLMMDKEVIGALDRLDRKMKETTLEVQVFYAELGADIIPGALDQFNKVLKTTREELVMIAGLYRTVRNMFNPGMGAGAALGTTPSGNWQSPVTVPMPPRPDDKSAKAKPSGGGGGGAQRDVLGALRAEGLALEISYERVLGFARGTTDEMLKEADLADRIAKAQRQALQHIPEGDKQKRADVMAQIEVNERQRAAIDGRTKLISEALAIERRYGDGLNEHTQAMRRLDEALAANLITQGAHAAKVREVNEALQVQRDRVAEARGGVEGLTAGFLSAMRASDKANSTFQLGADLFDQSTRLMSDALVNFAQTGEISFKRLLGSFGDMLIQMGLKAAASSVFGQLGGLLGGLFGNAQSLGGGGFDLFGGALGNGVTGGLGGLGGLFGGMAGFAAGGRPPLGKVSLVGERGPELFVPDTAGTVVPNHALGGDGGGSVTVIQHNTFGEGVNGMTKAEIFAALRATKDAAVSEVYERRRRGGSFASAFRS